MSGRNKRGDQIKMVGGTVMVNKVGLARAILATKKAGQQLGGVTDVLNVALGAIGELAGIEDVRQKEAEGIIEEFETESYGKAPLSNDYLSNLSVAERGRVLADFVRRSLGEEK